MEGLAEQPLTRELLSSLTGERLREAKALLDADCWSGAYYLAGYAVELALKARIAGMFKADMIPDRNFVQRIYSHRLNELASLAGLTAQLTERSARDVMFEANWDAASRWSEQSRYRMISEADARQLVAALDGRDGILRWISTLS